MLAVVQSMKSVAIGGRRRLWRTRRLGLHGEITVARRHHDRTRIVRIGFKVRCRRGTIVLARS